MSGIFDELGKWLSEASQSVTGTGSYAIPKCPTHGCEMRLREGKYGKFWSCPTRLSDGSYCKQHKSA